MLILTPNTSLEKRRLVYVKNLNSRPIHLLEMPSKAILSRFERFLIKVQCNGAREGEGRSNPSPQAVFIQNLPDFLVDFNRE